MRKNLDIKSKLSKIIKENDLHKDDHIILSRSDYIQLTIELKMQVKVEDIIIWSYKNIKSGRVQIADKSGVETVSLY